MNVSSPKPIPTCTPSQEKNKTVYLYIGQRIKERRKLLKMNQTQLAKLMGFSYQQMQKYENGISEISVEKLLRFAHIFNVPPTYFFEGARINSHIGEHIENDLIQKTRTSPLQLLLVEHNPNDVILFKKALNLCNEQTRLHVIHNPSTVHDYLQNYDTKYGNNAPDLIILDVSLPKISGMELLKSIKNNTQTQKIPVIIVTNSINKKEMCEAYRRGAAGFIPKSIELEEYTETINTVIKYWARVVILPNM